MTSSVKEDALGWSLYSLYFVDLMKRDENDSFECLTCSYLMTDPAGTSQFSDVWLWGSS